jgi:hypothetical protein
VEILEKRVEQLTAVTQLIERIEQLESRSNQNSENSSKQSTLDPLYQRPERGTKKFKRRRGVQNPAFGSGSEGIQPQLNRPQTNRYS